MWWVAAFVGTTTVAPVLDIPPALQEAPFSVVADRLISEGGRYVAEGNVELRRKDAIVYADRVEFDQARGVAIAEGNVTARQGQTVLTCTKIETKIPELTGGLWDAELRIKSGLPKELQAQAPPMLRRQGDDEMIVSAKRLSRTGPRTFEVEDGAFTVCDCGEDSTPSWRIESSSAEVDVDQGALLYWPVFYAKQVPIFALPVFYMPLGERRTGLLTPRPTFSQVGGFTVAQPLYITLGRSWDTTLEGIYFAERGPGLGLELRWAPSERSRGQVNGAFILDFGEQQPSGNFDKKRSSPIPRYGLAAQHRTAFSPRTKLAADINLLSDPAYLEFADDFLRRQNEFSRSRVTVAHSAASSLRVAAGLQLMQDLRGVTYAGAGPTREVRLLSGDIPGPGLVRYRFFDLRLDAPPHALFASAPILGQARASVQAFSAPRPELARFIRADIRPEISAPISVFGLFTLEPSVSARGTVWGGRFASENVNRTRFAAALRASAYTTLWRDYGSVIHRLQPELTYLLIPRVWAGGDDVFGTDDEIDQLAAAQQVRARLLSDWTAPSGARIGGLSVWFGHDFSVFSEKEEGLGSSEVVVEGDTPLFPEAWPVRLHGRGRIAIATEDPKVTDLMAGLALTAPFVTLAASYAQLDARMPLYSFISPEELVPSGTIDTSPYIPLSDYRALALSDRVDLKPWSAYRGITGSVRLTPFAPLTLGFDVVLTFDDPETSLVRNTASSVRWNSPCRCWSAELIVTTARDRPGFPGFQFALDLSRLGSI